MEAPRACAAHACPQHGSRVGRSERHTTKPVGERVGKGRGADLIQIERVGASRARSVPGGAARREKVGHDGCGLAAIDAPSERYRGRGSKPVPHGLGERFRDRRAHRLRVSRASPVRRCGVAGYVLLRERPAPAVTRYRCGRPDFSRTATRSAASQRCRRARAEAAACWATSTRFDASIAFRPMTARSSAVG